jgi:RND superfamily putative drug exporter
MDQAFPELAGTRADVVFQAPTGATVAGDKNSVEDTITSLKAIANVTSVSDPFSTETELLHSQTSADGTIAHVTVGFTDSSADLLSDTFDKIEAAAKPAIDAGHNVQFGGQLVDAQNAPKSSLSSHADSIGVGIALVLLLLVFGSLLVAVLPIVSAIVGVGLAGSLVAIAETFLTIPEVGPILGSMLGLGVDHSLFILTRGLGELEDGHDPVDAMGTAMATAGKAV